MTSGYTQCPCCGYDTVSSDMAEPELCELCDEAGCDESYCNCQRDDIEDDVDGDHRVDPHSNCAGSTRCHECKQSDGDA